MTTTSDKPSTRPQFKVVGTRPVRHDGVDKVTGKAVYGADLSLPGTLFGKILRSPHAHARIKKIDTSLAEAHPDVKAVVTFRDFPTAEHRIMEVGEDNFMSLRYTSNNSLAEDKALYKGHAIAAIAASSPHLAEELLGLIKVEYEVLPAVTDPEEAFKPGAPVLHEHLVVPDGFEGRAERRNTNISGRAQYALGDVEAGFNQADIIVEREFRTKMIHQGYIEPQNVTAWWNQPLPPGESTSSAVKGKDEGRLTIWNSSQGPFGVRDQVARILSIPVSSVKVVPLEIGGGFGGKLGTYVEPVAAVLSKKSGRPVKITLNRQEVLEATGPASGSYMKVKIGATKDGRLTAGQGFVLFESGAYPGSSHGGACMSMFSPYDLPNIKLESCEIVNNKPSTAAYRAPGAPHGSYAGECVIDELAEKLGMDPMEFRLKNAAKEGTRMVSGVAHPRIGNIETMNAVKSHPHYSAPLGKNVGRGVAIGSWGNAGGAACAIVNVLPNGKVSLVEGSADIGGTRTAAAQQLAEVLGLPVEEIMPSVGDTDTVGFTSNTGGSSVAFKQGVAAFHAGNDIKGQMVQRAAKLWETTPDNVAYADGVLQSKLNPAHRMTFKQMAAMYAKTGGPIVGRANVASTGAGRSFAAVIADVHVDPETGKTQVLRCTAFQDAGVAIHPSYVEGQIQGGAVQGIGWALNEEYVYAPDGRLMNPTLLDYRMPTTLDLPMIDAVIIEVYNPNHPFGVRGVGEANIIPPLAAVANAVSHAIGVRMTELPMSPPVIVRVLQKQAAGNGHRK
ncbi:MAG: xanthine dehydrogenase family protein molybdopterin-binding subunit [SAR202 cluster bacterium]|nr:xanthine dehydrogenase family protein molybdopterin-binding subunit [SAR202 cluster bacterium]